MDNEPCWVEVQDEDKWLDVVNRCWRWFDLDQHCSSNQTSLLLRALQAEFGDVGLSTGLEKFEEAFARRKRVVESLSKE